MSMNLSLGGLVRLNQVFRLLLLAAFFPYLVCRATSGLRECSHRGSANIGNDQPPVHVPSGTVVDGPIWVTAM